MPTLTIDGHKIEVEPGTSIIQAAEMLGIEIPRFCYHDKLSVPANCRMCLVEVEGGPPKPQASCALACGEGMVVKTDTEMVRKARKGVMEMLLINHPLDCPICDQGGECDLQDQAVGYGFDRSRYHENKRAVPNKEIGPLIKTIMTRCIQCTRCVRFGEEIAGVSDLGLLHRGEDVEIDTFVEKAITSELSGNMIDVCPVGALTSKPYAYQARPWELTKTETIDVHDAVGSNIRVDARGGEVMRVLPRLNEDINEEWISDKTRFAVDGLKHNRLDRPYVRGKNGKLEEASWDEALATIALKLRSINPEKSAAFAGNLSDIESMTALKDLMGTLDITQIESRAGGPQYDVSERAAYLFNTTIADIEQADAILLVGTNPRVEAAMINARIRKAWLNNKTKIGLIGDPCDLTYSYEHIGTRPADLEKLLKSRGGFADTLKQAKNPMIILGPGALLRNDAKAIQELAYQAAEKFGMIREDWNGYNALHAAAARVGALDIGFSTDKAIDLKSLEFVYCMGLDELDWNAVSKKAFVVYQGHHGDAGAARADVILPGAAYTEKDGLYVNTEGRVQQALRAVSPLGEAREDWKIIRALSGIMGNPLPYNSILDLRARMFEEWPHLEKIGQIEPAPWLKFGSKGKLLDQKLKSPVQNFYITNVICKNSQTMQNCTAEFSKQSPQTLKKKAA